MNVFRLSLALLLAGIFLPGCNEVDVTATGGAAGQASTSTSPEILRLVNEIDALLAVPQDSYPDGNEVSGAFEEFLDTVVRQPRTLRTHAVAQSLGYFVAHGHSLGWDPKAEDVKSLQGDWQELRVRLLTGP